MEKFVLFVEKEPQKKLSKSTHYQKVRNYCHYTGTCTGAAHDIYNSKFNVPNKIPVVFHNN